MKSQQRKKLQNEIKKYGDLYQYEVIVAMIKQSKLYHSVTYREKSIPQWGSQCRNIETLNNYANVKVLKQILHRNGDITLKTDFGYLKFCN